MPQFNLKQLQYELDTWKRLLSFIREENICFKHRLSEVLKEQFNHDMLEEIENFQNDSVKVDEWILRLQENVVKMDNIVTMNGFEDGVIRGELANCVKKFRNRINVTETEFLKLKNEFNNYLSEDI